VPRLSGDLLAADLPWKQLRSGLSVRTRTTQGAWVGGGKCWENQENAGYSHDIIENKGTENVAQGLSHDVDEKTRLISPIP